MSPLAQYLGKDCRVALTEAARRLLVNHDRDAQARCSMATF